VVTVVQFLKLQVISNQILVKKKELFQNLSLVEVHLLFHPLAVNSQQPKVENFKG